MLTSSMQTRVMWAHHTLSSSNEVGAMRIFNSSGLLAVEGVGGENLGTFEPGWLEWRRAKILATRKRSHVAADNPGAEGCQPSGLSEEMRAYSTCWATLPPVDSMRSGDRCLLLSRRAPQAIVASKVSPARLTVATLFDGEASATPSLHGVQLFFAVAQQLSGFVPRRSYSCSRTTHLPQTLHTVARGVFRAFCV